MTGLRRVVVTGVGMVSPLGAGVENVWRRLLNSESGIATIEGFDASHLPSTIGGEVPLLGGPKSDDPFALDPETVMPDKERRRRRPPPSTPSPPRPKRWRCRAGCQPTKKRRTAPGS